MSNTRTHYRTCNLCEAMCGIEIEYEGNKIHSIKGDKKDPLSEGHICPKAVALQDVYNDPDRLKTPIRKTKDGWKPISWEDAFAEIETKIKAIQSKYGNDSVGIYLGNPNAHIFGNNLFLPFFIKALNSKNRYSASSVDQLPHHAASNYMFGNGILIPIPDIDRTDFMLIIGGNPMVSNGSLMTSPNFAKRMKNIQSRGGKVVVVDPRKTLTAKKADQHFFIQPESDALLLLGLIKTILDKDLEDLGHLKSSIVGFDILKEIIKDFSLEKIESATGIPKEQIKQLATEFAHAKSAICYSRMGASTQSFGGLCLWLTNVLNIITGNLDSKGGAMFTQPAFDVAQMKSKKGKQNSYGRYQSRVRKLPYFNNEFPAATLADEILTEGEGQIKAMFCIAGNPVLSTPNGERLAEAFDQLDFMVAQDIYLNETSRHADIILPGATGLETSHFDVVFNVFAVRNVAKYSPALFEKTDEQRHDWEILKRLTSIFSNRPENALTPEMMLEGGLMASGYAKDGLNLEKLKQYPHGMDLGEMRPCIQQRIQTDDDKIQLTPKVYIDDLERLKSTFFNNQNTNSEFPLRLIGRRLLRSHNTWLHNSYRLVKGRNECTLIIHPTDAARFHIENGQIVKLSSNVGSVEIEAKVSDEIMEGVVCMPQGWGHNKKGIKLSVAQAHAGASINDLTDHMRIDELTGNAAVNGFPVKVEVLVNSSVV